MDIWIMVMDWLLMISLACSFIIYIKYTRAVDARDQQHLDRLRTERKAKIGSFRGSHHNLQKLIEV